MSDRGARFSSHPTLSRFPKHPRGHAVIGTLAVLSLTGTALGLLATKLTDRTGPAEPEVTPQVVQEVVFGPRQFETAGDGVEAIEHLAAQSFDLLLTDVVMPRMDGHKLYLTLKESHPDLPSLMMTAFPYDKDHIIKRARMKGLKGVIFKKPLDPGRLRQVICETLGR